MKLDCFAFLIFILNLAELINWLNLRRVCAKKNISWFTNFAQQPRYIRVKRAHVQRLKSTCYGAKLRHVAYRWPHLNTVHVVVISTASKEAPVMSE
jgi:hypothetical protein